MDALVVDSGVVVKWFVSEPDSHLALAVRDQFIAGNLILLAPDFLPVEVGNVLWKKQRQGLATAAEATSILATVLACGIVWEPVSALLPQALNLAMTYQRSVYDMLYVALAVREGCDLVTADERLANSRASTMPQVKKLANWP